MAHGSNMYGPEKNKPPVMPKYIRPKHYIGTAAQGNKDKQAENAIQGVAGQVAAIGKWGNGPYLAYKAPETSNASRRVKPSAKSRNVKNTAASVAVGKKRRGGK